MITVSTIEELEPIPATDLKRLTWKNGVGRTIWEDTPRTRKRNEARYESNKAIRRLGIKKEKCTECDSKLNLHIHHIDKDKTNNVIENLAVLCSSCHRGKHMDLPEKLFI